MSLEWLAEPVPARAGLRRQVVLEEFDLGHVPAFRQVLADHLGMAGRALPEQPAWFRGPTGGLYEVVLTARAGEHAPSGMEVAALPERFVPLRATMVDEDLWAFLLWFVERVGPPWTVEALVSVAALYRVPKALRAPGA